MPAAVTAQHFHTLFPWLLQVNSSWAVTNMIHHLGKPRCGKTQAQTHLGGWWGWNLSSLKLPPRELGTGEPPEVEEAGNVKCFIHAHWEFMPTLPRYLKMCCVNCGGVYMKICVGIHYIWCPSDCGSGTGPKTDGLPREPLPQPGEALWVNGDGCYLKQIQSGWLSVS